MKVLTLRSDGLLSKWGFGDGDEPDELLDELDDRGMSYPEDWHAILRALVREHLVPVLEQNVEVVDVETIHNPIRAASVDGVDVVDWWRGEAVIRLTPDHVDVPIDKVIEAIEHDRTPVDNNSPQVNPST